MKKILVTESQYKRLVKNLNEQYVVYNNIEDEKDVSNEILQTLYYLTSIFKENGITKDIYVDKIENGIVYLDDSKYSVLERKIIEDAIKKYISYVINPKDKILPNELAFNSGIDSDWVNNDVAKVEDDSDVIADDCTLTTEEERYFNNQIKNTSDGNGFRKWINNDSNRLNDINKILSDCGLTDGLDSYGSINDHLKIAFKYKGKEWINLGKPEIEKIESGDLVFLSPNKKGFNLRSNDCYGSGKYGASRKNRLGGIRAHEGVDVISNEGDLIYSPMDGYISGLDYRVYSNKCSYLVGVDVTGTGKYAGIRIRLFYVKGSLRLNTKVRKGDIIGTQQSLHKNCYPKMINGKYCMTNHVHVELIHNGVKKDPTLYNWGSGVNKKLPDNRVDKCALSSKDQDYFDKHIKNTLDGDGFRKWVNKNTDILNFVNDKLSDCGLTDGLDPYGSINDHLRIAFKYEGKEWVSLGKPEISYESHKEVEKDKNIPSIEGNSGYILGKKITVDKNGPKNHASRKLGNWQSDNATDIFGKPGTTVYSITKGVVSKIGGNDNDHNGKIYGGNITVKGKNGYSDIFYTHLQKIKVVKGQEVTLGTPLAEISLWKDSPSGSHVHVGLPYGVKLDTLLDLSTGKIK